MPPMAYKLVKSILFTTKIVATCTLYILLSHYVAYDMPSLYPMII